MVCLLKSAITFQIQTLPEFSQMQRREKIVRATHSSTLEPIHKSIELTSRTAKVPSPAYPIFHTRTKTHEMEGAATTKSGNQSKIHERQSRQRLYLLTQTTIRYCLVENSRWHKHFYRSHLYKSTCLGQAVSCKRIQSIASRAFCSPMLIGTKGPPPNR